MKELLRIFVLFLFFVVQSCSGVGLKPGNIAPNFTLKTIEDKKISLESLKGKVVLLHFWTDFCVSCKAEFPKIQAYYDELKSKDFELLAINLGQPVSVSQDFQREFKVTFPMLTDTQGVMKEIYQINQFPINYFINPEGKIIRVIKGWIDKKQVEVFINQNKK